MSPNPKTCGLCGIGHIIDRSGLDLNFIKKRALFGNRSYNR